MMCVFPVVGIVLKKGRAILLQERAQAPFQEYLTLPVGKIKRGETIFEAFEREVKEETGLVVLESKLKGLVEVMIANQRTHTLVVLLESTRFKGKLRASREGKLYWVREKELEQFKIMPDIKLLFGDFLGDHFMYANVHLKMTRAGPILDSLKKARQHNFLNSTFK